MAESHGSEYHRQLNLYQAGFTPHYPLFLPGAKTFYVGVSTYRSAADGLPPTDGNDGETPQAPVATASQAHTLAVSGRGDTIVFLPGSHTLASDLTITKDNIRLVAVYPFAATISGAQIIVDADGVEFAGLRFTDTASENMIKFANSVDTVGGWVHHCQFTGSGASGAVGVVVGEGASGNNAREVIIEHSRFEDWNGSALTIFGKSCKIDNVFLKAPTGSTCMTLGDYGTAAAVGNRDGLTITNTIFMGASTACTALAITVAGAEANTGLYAIHNAFAAHLGDNSNDGITTADRHPEGIGEFYYGTAGDTDPDLVAG